LPFETKRYLFEALMNAKLKKNLTNFPNIKPQKVFCNSGIQELENIFWA
jgi:hypothetical protein